MSDNQESMHAAKLAEFENQLKAFGIKAVVFGSTNDPEIEAKASKEMFDYVYTLTSLYSEALKGSNV